MVPDGQQAAVEGASNGGGPGRLHEKPDDPFIEEWNANAQFYEMAADAITRRVNERIDTRLDRRNTASVGVASILAAAFLAIATAAGGYFGGWAIDFEVRQRFDQVVEERIDDLQFQGELSVLRVLAGVIDANDSFTDQQASELIRLIEETHANYTVITEGATAEAVEEADDRRDDLRPVFETMVMNFLAARRHDLVDDLSRKLPDLAEGNTGVMIARVDLLGTRLIGAPNGASAWLRAGSPLNSIYEDYREAVEWARTSRYPELYYVYEAIIGSVEKRPLEDIMFLVDQFDGDLLTEADRRNLDDTIRKLATGTYAARPDANSQRVASRTRAFVERFADRSETLAAIASDLPAQD